MSWQKFRLSTLELEMMVESRTHPCIGANHLPELNQSRQQLPLCDTRHRENYPASDEKEFPRREVPPRGVSAIARPTSIPVLVALISTAPILPLLVSPLIVVIIPLLLTVAMRGSLM